MAWPKGRHHSAETKAKLAVLRVPLADRFWSKVDRRGEDECWHWTASRRRDGYGQIGYKGRPHVAHRIAWLLAYGYLPTAHIDHMCHNADPQCPGGDDCQHRSCVNPSHLRDVSQKRNLLASSLTLPGMNAKKTHCTAGHQFDTANTYIRPDGKRDCRRCRADAEARRRARVRTS